MTGDRPALAGLLLYLLIAVTPMVLLWVVPRVLPPVVSSIVEWHRGRRPRVGPSCESVVANLRRLRREMRGAPPPNQVKQVALFSAYDQTLLDVCAMVGVDAPLAAATGSDRALARLLTEAALEDAGIALDPPTGSSAAA